MSTIPLLQPMIGTNLIIDFDRPPSIPTGWTILSDDKQLPNRVRGRMEFDQRKVMLHLDEEQRGGRYIQGTVLLDKIRNAPVYGAQLLDFYLAHPEHIPEIWKKDEHDDTPFIFFMGTIYANANGLPSVRCLYWINGGWWWNCMWLNYHWHSYHPLACAC